METIVYVCTDQNKKYLGTFNSRELAEASWKLTCSKFAGTLEFQTEAGYWKVLRIDGGEEHIGYIWCETAMQRIEHL